MWTTARQFTPEKIRIPRQRSYIYLADQWHLVQLYTAYTSRQQFGSQPLPARPAFPAPPYLFFLAGSGPLGHMHSMVVCVVTRETPELVVLVDFKAIYPGVPPGIFASFPGVAHFLSFEQICQYPRESRKYTGYPGVLFPWGRPRGNPNTLG